MKRSIIVMFLIVIFLNTGCASLSPIEILYQNKIETAYQNKKVNDLIFYMCYIDEYEYVLNRFRARQRLIDLGVEAVEELVKNIVVLHMRDQEKDGICVQLALDALEKIGPPADKLLIPLLKVDYNNRYWFQAYPSVWEDIAYVRHKTWVSRSFVARTLGRMASNTAIDGLIDALDTDIGEGESVVQALIGTKSPLAIEPLKEYRARMIKRLKRIQHNPEFDSTILSIDNFLKEQEK